MRIKLLLMTSLLLMNVNSWSNTDGGDAKVVNAQISHDTWNALLAKHVSASGSVNYAAFQKDSVLLNKYLNLLSKHDPNSEYLSEDARKAFWINAYNAFTIKLIVMYYPLSSIRDLGSKIKIGGATSAWDFKFFSLNGQKMSLNHIEHEILRKKFNDPRIHFAINCASISCPILLNRAFIGHRLENQLDTQTKAFVNDQSKNKVSAEKVEISELWKWFEGDFTKNGNLISFLNTYSRTKISSKAKVTYLAYDWNLNE